VAPCEPSALKVMPPPFWPAAAPESACTKEARETGTPRPVPADAISLLAPLAPATAASKAAEAPPAVLAAAVFEGNRSGVIAPRPVGGIPRAALVPPRGACAAPPPGPLAGCQGAEMPSKSEAFDAAGVLKVSQSFAESLPARPAVESAPEAAAAEPPPAKWLMAIASIDLSNCAGIVYGLGLAWPACVAASLARASGLGALLPPKGDMSPSWANPRKALIASPVKLIGSVMVVLDSRRSRRSTFLAKRRRRASVKLRCRRRKFMVRSWIGR
jgi:hypothetical protein